ncbi:response regulator transcription factor [Paraburkholderia kururiensis]|uniref:response regulator transcription factor n=1 Tax=Paraburkholderia kururiensis TaxID=984307 RepID=UPI000478230E|nr:response regulator transcription factor [Paraburkholderia kururiensis]
MKVLLAEDNESLSHWLLKLLKEERMAVDRAADGDAADQLLRTEQYDVVLLDLQLPKMTGKDVLRRLRGRRNNVPVLVVTASGSIDEKVECLGAGADDYIVKPFETRELVARIKALARRQNGEKHTDFACGDLTYNTDSRQFRIRGEPLSLRPKEHSILEMMMLKCGKTLSKSALMSGVYALEEESSEDAIEIYVHRIRKRIEHCDATIVTLRGMGYLLQEKKAQPG